MRLAARETHFQRPAVEKVDLHLVYEVTMIVTSTIRFVKAVEYTQ